MSAAAYWRRFWATKFMTGYAFDEHGEPADATPAYYQREAAVIRLITGQESPRTVLELGCGGGLLYDAMGLLSADYTGVDFSPTMLDRFRERHPSARLIVADAASFYDATRTFELILSVGVVHYFNREMFRSHLQNARRMLSPGGVLLCGDLRWRALFVRSLIASFRAFRMWKPRPEFSLNVRDLYHEIVHTNAFTISELHRLARDEGLTCEIYGSLNMPGTLHACFRVESCAPSQPQA